MKSASENTPHAPPASSSRLSKPAGGAVDELARILIACGFDARAWRGQRIYLGGYGRDITAYLEPRDLSAEFPADAARLDVRSSWQAARYNGLRCKGVKHEILKDLWRARVISSPPPERWQDVSLADAPVVRPPIRPFEPQNSESA